MQITHTTVTQGEEQTQYSADTTTVAIPKQLVCALMSYLEDSRGYNYCTAKDKMAVLAHRNDIHLFDMAEELNAIQRQVMLGCRSVEIQEQLKALVDTELCAHCPKKNSKEVVDSHN